MSKNIWCRIKKKKKKKSVGEVMERFFKRTRTFFHFSVWKSRLSRACFSHSLCHASEKGLLSPTYRETIFRYTFLFEKSKENVRLETSCLKLG